MGTPPIGAFTIGGIPSDILAGHSITATILADDAAGNPLDGYTGPISVRISDPQNNTIYSTSGNFDPSQFTLGPVTLNNTGTLPVTDTITITAGTTTESLPIVVHPVSQFVATENSLTVAEQTPFDISFAAEDDRGVFDSSYSGSAKLTYTDNHGEHDLGGGFQAVSGGVVAFQNVVLPSGGVYLLQAVSADGNVVGNFFVDSQGTVVDNTPPSSSVSPLPSYEASGSFTVAWSGNDDANGSGIAIYDIYVSDDGGPYTAWLSGTTLTSATYAGQDYHTYRFYSEATDNAGNVQAAKSTADASTTVIPAGTAVWSGGGADNHWSTAANWATSNLPSPGTDLGILRGYANHDRQQYVSGHVVRFAQPGLARFCARRQRRDPGAFIGAGGHARSLQRHDPTAHHLGQQRHIRSHGSARKLDRFREYR